MGTGIEKLESEAARFYPAARIHCLDKETNSLPKRADLIIATQAILKWQHSFRPELIAVIDYDGALNHFDFRSGEKAFSLLVHLRNLAKEKLLIQTRMPDDYGLKALRKMDFNGFYRQELKFRKELSLPPYQYLIAIGLRADKEETVFELSNELFGRLETQRPKGVEISDPHPASLPKLRDQYRYTILLKAKQVKPILTFIKKVLKSLKRRKGVFISIDVDPHW